MIRSKVVLSKFPTIEELKKYSRNSLVEWLIENDLKYNLKSSVGTYQGIGLYCIKEEVLARVELEKPIYKEYQRPNLN